MKEIIFYYDVVCPFAYVASRLVEGVAARSGAKVRWTPVLLGGLYEASDAPQGKNASATSVMAPARRLVTANDLRIQLQRYKIPFSSPTNNPQRTLDAMRLLAVSPTEQPVTTGDQRSAVLDNSIRRSLSDALYRAYWVDDQDLTDRKFLASMAQKVGWSVDVMEVLDSSRPLGKQAKSQLEINTKEAADRGAFGVPSFWVNERLYWGVDRLSLIESEISGQHAPLFRVARVPSDAAQRPEQTLTVYFDFSSPWTFLGVSQIPALLESLRPLRVRVEWVPVLLGAVFKAIGTPVVPMQALSPAKAAYAQQDLNDWLKYRGVRLQFTSHFPLRTVLPLRVFCARPEDKLRDAIFAAGWQKDLDIGNPEVLCDVLDKAGYDGRSLIAQAADPAIKDMLKKSTARGVDAGICGAPCFQVNGGEVIFGQDRLSLVADLLCGWSAQGIQRLSKL